MKQQCQMTTAKNKQCQRRDTQPYTLESGTWMVCTKHIDEHRNHGKTLIPWIGEEPIRTNEKEFAVIENSEEKVTIPVKNQKEEVVQPKFGFVSRLTAEEVHQIAPTLDMNLIGQMANEIFDTTFKTDWVDVREEWSGQALDNSRPGFIYNGSMYIARLVKDVDNNLFIKFDAHDMNEMRPINMFINKQKETAMEETKLPFAEANEPEENPVEYKEVMVLWLVHFKAKDNTTVDITYTKREKRMIESFKILRENLVSEHTEDIKGWIVFYGGKQYWVKPDGTWKETTKKLFSKLQRDAAHPNAIVGITCKKCSHWENGSYIMVKHATMDEIRACSMEGQS